MEKLERYRGHFYNWYDTRTLQPLHPQYVSSVDSGNLAGSLLTLQAGLAELKDQPVLSANALQGLQDTLQVLAEHVPASPAPDLAEKIRSLQDTLRALTLERAAADTGCRRSACWMRFTACRRGAACLAADGNRYRWRTVLLGAGIRPAIPRTAGGARIRWCPSRGTFSAIPTLAELAGAVCTGHAARASSRSGAARASSTIWWSVAANWRRWISSFSTIPRAAC